MGCGPRPHAPRTGGWAWESAPPRTPHTQARGARPPGALVPPPQRANPALRSAHCGVCDGSPRQHPLHPQLVGSEPRPHAPRTGGRAWDSAQSWTLHTKARGPPPPGARVPPPQRAKPARKSARCGVNDGSQCPHPLLPQPVGSGPRPHTPRTGGRTLESAQPRTPHTQARGAPPRAPSCHPHSPQSQLARARAVVLVTGPHLHPPHPQPVGGQPRPHAPRTGGQVWESARPRTPHTQARGPPPRPPRAAPTAGKASSQGQARPQGGERPQARQGDEGTGPPHPELNRRSTGPGQETRRGTKRLERPYRRPAPEPRVVRARHRPGGVGGAYAKGRDTRTGQPATCTARDAREGMSENRQRPRPPRPAASTAHTRPGHCTPQGSSSTQCYTPTPRLGSLRASPWGSHWRQASSTGPAAPAARATTHQ